MNCWQIGLTVFIAFSLAGAQINRNDEILQISTIDALLGGIYDGEVNIGQLLKFGDFGLGTFNSLDGEMVVLDGVSYQVRADGKVLRVNSSLKTPFAAVTFFESDTSIVCKDTLNLELLEKKIDSLIVSVNYLYAIKISGHFISATARSVPAQKPPYRPLSEITSKQQTFTFNNMRGTLVGFRCPPYVKGLNVSGYHLHLLNESRNAGGHLLSMKADSLIIEIDRSDSYRILLPHDKEFSYADLTRDKEEELRKVER